MVQDCPSKKSKAHGAKLTEGSKQDIIDDLANWPPWPVKDMIACAAKFSEEERTTFIQGLQDNNEETTDNLGFLEAWADWP